MRLSALSLPDKTPEAKGECMSDRERPIGLHTYTTRARSGHGSQIMISLEGEEMGSKWNNGRGSFARAVHQRITCYRVDKLIYQAI